MCLWLPGLILDSCISAASKADSQDKLSLEKAHCLEPYSATLSDEQVRMNVNLVLNRVRHRKTMA